MAKSVFYIAKTEVQAVAIVDHLKTAGFSPNDISVLFPDKIRRHDHPAGVLLPCSRMP